MLKSKYDWAVNAVKLEQAITQLKVVNGGKEPSESEAKEAYIKRGGLVKESSHDPKPKEETSEERGEEKEEAPRSRRGSR